MTIREAITLIALYRTCVDPALRAQAVRLVPELAEWDEVPLDTQIVWQDGRPPLFTCPLKPLPCHGGFSQVTGEGGRIGWMKRASTAGAP